MTPGDLKKLHILAVTMQSAAPLTLILSRSERGEEKARVSDRYSVSGHVASQEFLPPKRERVRVRVRLGCIIPA